MLSLAPAPATMAPLPVYDWTYPALMQQHDWDCSQESICWCLYAYGRTPDESWMEQSMIDAGVVDPAVGCTDASGAGLASWLNDEYGEYGYLSSNNPSVSFDDVAREAATHLHPLAVGGRAFYHWVGVRGYDAYLDRLMLANPAPGYRGIYQTLDRRQFAELGPFSLVRLTHPAAEGAGGGGTPSLLPAGIDVSSHQGQVDWAAVRQAGAAFSFTKATGGAWYTNPTLPQNWQGMLAAGLQRGAYHFAFETSGQPFPGPGPEAEAAYFLDAVMPLGLSRGDMLVLDLEQGAGDLGQWALRWLRQVEAFAGFPPLLYTRRSFAEAHGLTDVPELGRYLLWEAAYQPTMPPPYGPWAAITFWQFTDRATVPGVSTPVDGNWFNGAPADLPACGMPGGPPPEDPYAQWAGLVGSGILEMMAVDATLPAQRASTFLPPGANPADVEQCFGQNGTNYVWLLAVNAGFRFYPG
jgi:lysozyme